jgi:hypothetical protein
MAQAEGINEVRKNKFLNMVYDVFDAALDAARSNAVRKFEEISEAIERTQDDDDFEEVLRADDAEEGLEGDVEIKMTLGELGPQFDNLDEVYAELDTKKKKKKSWFW